MGRIYFPAEMGSWWIGAEEMVWPGGVPLDLQKLWGRAIPEIDNHRHPEVDGRYPMDPFDEESTHDIGYWLSGLWFPDGSSTNRDLAAGFEANYDELVRKVGHRSTWGGPTVASTLKKPSGAMLFADIQAFVHPPGSERAGVVMPAVVTVTIPRGQFEPAGS